MVPSLIARVDGLPQLVTPERVWPNPTCPAKTGEARRRRERDARQSAVVQQARLPRWAHSLLAVPDFEQTEIRADLEHAGLL
jgi:hypothetical protein